MLLGKLAQKAGRLLPQKKPKASLQRREEIVLLREQLQQFGIELSQLAGDAPRGGHTPQLLELSRTLAQQQHVLTTLSLGDEAATQLWLDAHSGAISPQMWEEHRSYIVTMAHIYAGPYPELRAYLE